MTLDLTLLELRPIPLTEGTADVVPVGGALGSAATLGDVGSPRT